MICASMSHACCIRGGDFQPARSTGWVGSVGKRRILRSFRSGKAPRRGCSTVAGLHPLLLLALQNLFFLKFTKYPRSVGKRRILRSFRSGKAPRRGCSTVAGLHPLLLLALQNLFFLKFTKYPLHLLHLLQ